MQIDGLSKKEITFLNTICMMHVLETEALLLARMIYTLLMEKTK